MTDLALKFPTVLLMHFNLILPGGCGDMTGLTARQLRAIITMFRWREHAGFWAFMTILAVSRLSMQLMIRMAAHTAHTPLAKMHIRLKSFMFPHIFITNPAAVTGCTVARH